MMKMHVLVAGLVGLSQGAWAAPSLLGEWIPLGATCSSGAAYDDGTKPGEKSQVIAKSLVISAETFRLTLRGTFDLPEKPATDCTLAVDFGYSLEGDVLKIGNVLGNTSNCSFQIKNGDIVADHAQLKVKLTGKTLRLTDVQAIGADGPCPAGDVSTTFFVREFSLIHKKPRSISKLKGAS